MIYNHPIGSIYHLYTTYSPCLLGDYISPIPPIKGTIETAVELFLIFVDDPNEDTPPKTNMEPKNDGF